LPTPACSAIAPALRPGPASPHGRLSCSSIGCVGEMPGIAATHFARSCLREPLSSWGSTPIAAETRNTQNSRLATLRERSPRVGFRQALGDRDSRLVPRRYQGLPGGVAESALCVGKLGAVGPEIGEEGTTTLDRPGIRFAVGLSAMSPPSATTSVSREHRGASCWKVSAVRLAAGSRQPNSDLLSEVVSRLRWRLVRTGWAARGRFVTLGLRSRMAAGAAVTMIGAVAAFALTPVAESVPRLTSLPLELVRRSRLR
jgi:hypothetical protein